MTKGLLFEERSGRSSEVVSMSIRGSRNTSSPSARRRGGHSAVTPTGPRGLLVWQRVAQARRLRTRLLPCLRDPGRETCRRPPSRSWVFAWESSTAIRGTIREILDRLPAPARRPTAGSACGALEPKFWAAFCRRRRAAPTSSRSPVRGAGLAAWHEVAGDLPLTDPRGVARLQRRARLLHRADPRPRRRRSNRSWCRAREMVRGRRAARARRGAPARPTGEARAYTRRPDRARRPPSASTPTEVLRARPATPTEEVRELLGPAPRPGRDAARGGRSGHERRAKARGAAADGASWPRPPASRPPTIKHYLREGLLPEPVKTSRNMAYYPPEFVDRIRLIKRLQEERFMPLKAIKGGARGGPRPGRRAARAGGPDPRPRPRRGELPHQRRRGPQALRRPPGGARPARRARAC